MKILGRFTLIVCVLYALLFTAITHCQTVGGTHHIAFPFGTSAGQTSELRSYELTANGEHFFGIKAADSMAATTVYIAPTAFAPTNGFVLASTTGGVLSWVVQNVASSFVEQYAKGSDYVFTATKALLNFGTADPVITIPSAGTWMLQAYANVRLQASSSFTTSRDIHIQFRRSNNTPADLVSSDGVFCRVIVNTGIITTVANGRVTLPSPSLSCIYTTTNSDDIIGLFGFVSVLPNTGTLEAVNTVTYINAIKLF